MMADHSERPAAGSNLVRLEAIAVEAKLIRCSIRADVPDGYVLLSFVSHGQAERIQVSAGCAFHYGPGYAGPIPAVFVNPDRSTSFIRQSDSESYSWPEKSIGDALGSLVSDWKHATPDFDSIKIETKKSPVKGAELGQLLLAVWMEAFGQEAPSLEGLQKSVKRARSKKKDLRQQCLELLQSGPAGVKKWNELRDDDRTGVGKLGQCQFANCDLREVLFHNQDLRGSDFQQANLQAARMNGADCREAMFRGADLTGAFLSGGKFVQADFTDACCSNTAMRSADCRGAIFSGTDLSGADFGFGDIRQADLSTANLAGTDFFRAKYDEQTRFPAGFTIKSEWMMEWKGAVPREAGYTKHCSLEELLVLIPAPATPRETTGDWDEAATAIGTRFPSDFQSLIGKYGSGTILGDVEIYNPLIAADRKRIASDLDTLKQMREACEYLWQIHPEESGILPWGTDSNGNIFCWLTVGAPDEWPTALLGHGEDEPSSDAVNMTTFLYNFARNIYPEMQGGQTFSASNYKFEPRRDRPEYAHPARVEAKPAYSWDHLELTDPPAATATPVDVARCETEFGFRLPDSYADFVLRFSGGTLGDNFRINAPNELYQNLTKYRESVNSPPYRSIHAKHLPQLERLVPFCDTFYGDNYCWDTAETDASTGEYAVYYVERHKQKPKRIASSFAEFVLFVTEGKVRMPGMTAAKARRVNWKTFRPFVVAPAEPEYTKHCSLEELLAVIPAPENPCDPEGDWEEAAAWNGARYPSDFQLLVAKYGSGTILGDVQFFNPLNDEDRQSVTALLDILRQSHVGGEQVWQVHPEEYGILPWGTDSKGNIFCWITDDDPDEWSSAILSPGDDEPTGDHINITTFIYNISQNLYGELPGGLVFSKSDHKFEPKSELQAEYLRLQAELVAGWTYTNPMVDVVARMGTLRPKLSLDWLATVRTCTTPPSPVDVAALIPEFRALEKTTVRLNPRPGSTGPADSKIGGLFLWPQDQEWPHCDEHESAYVAALQIKKADFPEVVFPEETDLMQVLWCPNDHEPGYCPAVRVVWRKQADVTKPVNEHPVSKPEEYSNYVPRPCRLYPERIVEYPDPFEGLPEGVRDQLESLPQVAAALESNRALVTGNWSDHGEADRLYQCSLSTAEGTKLGGYPDWVQDPWYPKCQCGAPMEHLVSFGSREFDGETWFRWLPIEERDVLTAENKIRLGVQEAANWMFGDAGNMYVFICRQCPGWPVVAGMQCS